MDRSAGGRLGKEVIVDWNLELKNGYYIVTKSYACLVEKSIGHHVCQVSICCQEFCDSAFSNETPGTCTMTPPHVYTDDDIAKN